MLKAKILQRIIVTGFIVASFNAHSLDDSSYAKGRYWGQDPIEPQEKALPVSTAVTAQRKPSSKEVMASVSELIDEAKAKAILEPTMENVRSFITLKNKTGDMASKFSQVWQQVLIENSHLDYSVIRPTNSRAIAEMNLSHQQKIKDLLLKSAQSHGLIFFYKGKEALSNMQVETLNRMTRKYGFDLLGVSLDGVKISDITKNTIDGGQSIKMGVQRAPAVFALNTHTGAYFPVSYTHMSEVELEQRLFDIFTNFEDWK